MFFMRSSVHVFCSLGSIHWLRPAITLFMILTLLLSVFPGTVAAGTTTSLHATELMTAYHHQVLQYGITSAFMQSNANQSLITTDSATPVSVRDTLAPETTSSKEGYQTVLNQLDTMPLSLFLIWGRPIPRYAFMRTPWVVRSFLYPVKSS